MFLQCLWFPLGAGLFLLGAASLGAAVVSISHRGGAMYAPENTLAAFTNSVGVADLMETDVQITSDGQFVIMHDLTVDRTTDGSGAVVTQTLAQLRALDAGSWFGAAFAGQRIPTLEEMITNTLPHAIPFLERKAGGAAAYVAELRRLQVVTNVILQSFDWNFLAQVHALEPELPLCALGSGTLTPANLITITNAGARIVSWAGVNISTNEVQLVHALGLTLFVWTINSPVQITNYINLGVAGVVSDDPWAVRGLPPPVGTTNQPPAAAALRDGLIAYWKFDDGLTNAFASLVLDSFSTNSATLFRPDGFSHWGAAGSAPFGGCLQLAGGNAYVNVPSSPAFDIQTNAVSICAWVKLEQLPAQLATSFGAIFDSTTDAYVLYLDKANNELRFKVTDVTGQAARPGIPAAFLSTNQWLHVAAVYHGDFGPAGQATIYLNGQLMDAHIGNDAAPNSGLTANVKPGQVAALGREGPTGGNGFFGWIDDLALWRRALATPEIQNVYQAGRSGQTLGDLLIQPTNSLLITFLHSDPVTGELNLGFQSQGPWSRFQLRQATNAAGAFFPMPNLVPIDLGSGHYRFDYQSDGSAARFYRVEAF